MESLERNLEIYQRELAKATEQAKAYRGLIKATKEAIKERDELRESQENSQGDNPEEEG